MPIPQAVRRIVSTRLPTKSGRLFQLVGFERELPGKIETALALTMGELTDESRIPPCLPACRIATGRLDGSCPGHRASAHPPEFRRPECNCRRLTLAAWRRPTGTSNWPTCSTQPSKVARLNSSPVSRRQNRALPVQRRVVAVLADDGVDHNAVADQALLDIRGGSGAATTPCSSHLRQARFSRLLTSTKYRADSTSSCSLSS